MADNTSINDLQLFAEVLPTEVAPGAHQWPVNAADYGPEHDYYLIALGSDTAVIYAHSNAALQWCYRFLPPWVDRYKDKGFIIERKWCDFVCYRMREDALISLKEFEDACAENDNLARQFETTEEG